MKALNSLRLKNDNSDSKVSYDKVYQVSKMRHRPLKQGFPKCGMGAKCGPRAGKNATYL